VPGIAVEPDLACDGAAERRREVAGRGLPGRPP